MTRRAFLAKVAAAAATAVASPMLPAPVRTITMRVRLPQRFIISEAQRMVPVPLLFHPDAFALVMAPLKEPL